ncbi:serine hydrolase [Bryobacter aggregatus]|uniref:serine hydrolase n=1 Tax=Bryobacter aggregatus TaxID=360054 RepID=UPI0004E1C564|nr:serine hydrolase [Bryobacter aggregatus]
MRFLFFALLAAACAPAQHVADLLTAKMHDRIVAYDARMDGALGVAIIDLTTGTQWSYHGKLVFPTASAIKVPILMEIFRLRELGQLHFNEKVTLQPAEAVGGSGVLQERLRNGPITLSVEEIVREMIASSDNTATNWCIRRVGMAGVNHTMAQMGYQGTRLQRIMIDQAAATRNEENVSTPEDMADMLRVIYEGKAVNAKASAEMIAMLKLVKAGMRRAIPPAIEVASKPGELVGVRTETGIVYLKGRPFVLAVMGTYLNESDSPIEAVTKIVFDCFQKLAAGNIYGNLGVR